MAFNRLKIHSLEKAVCRKAAHEIGDCFGALGKTNDPYLIFFLGEIRQPLVIITEPEKLTLTLEAGKFHNHWDIWVYPARLPEIKPDVYVTQKLDARAMEVLKNGGNVLLTPVRGSLKADKGGDIAVGFSSIFWNTAWTNNQAPHTLGILCDPKHPVFNEFPTEFHSNWQ